MIDREPKESREREERLLDEALAATFPASDPIAVASPRSRCPQPPSQDTAADVRHP